MNPSPDRPRPRKRFGQHFLADDEIVRRIVETISPRPGETLVEIGPGHGVLTAPLAASGVSLHAIELDRDMVPGLRRRFATQANVKIHEADALRFDYASLGDGLRIAGNLPYNISTPLLFRLIRFRQSVLDLHLMLQKEVVDRLAAAPGGGTYGRLTIMAGSYMHVEPLFDVPPAAFRPAPRVVSTVVRLWPRTTESFDIADPDFLRSLVTQAFSQRRKTLRNALKSFATDGDFASLQIDPGTRAEQVPVPQWIALANRLSRQRRQAHM